MAAGLRLNLLDIGCGEAFVRAVQWEMGVGVLRRRGKVAFRVWGWKRAGTMDNESGRLLCAYLDNTGQCSCSTTF